MPAGCNQLHITAASADHIPHPPYLSADEVVHGDYLFKIAENVGSGGSLGCSV